MEFKEGVQVEHLNQNVNTWIVSKAMKQGYQERECRKKRGLRNEPLGPRMFDEMCMYMWVMYHNFKCGGQERSLSILMSEEQPPRKQGKPGWGGEAGALKRVISYAKGC